MQTTSDVDTDTRIVWRRKMQFCAGPETMVFEACSEHVLDLTRGVTCFLSITGEDMTQHEVDEGDVDCYFCREG